MIEIKDNFIDSVSLLKKEKKRRQETNFNTDELIENQLWIFLFDIGFTKLNIGRQCLVTFGKTAKESQTKNVDIIAESKEARLYIECTTQQNSSTKIKEWIADTVGIRKHEATNKDTEKKNVVYLFFTNQTISESDKKKLKENGVKLLNEKTLDYFNQLIKLYKNLAYYQLLAYLLDGQLIKSYEKAEFDIPAIRCKYSSKEHCYLFGIQPSKLIPLATVLHRKMNLDEDVSENYQRLVKSQKIKEIKKFITEQRGIFPTNIIISFETRGNDFFKPKGEKLNEIQFGVLTLPRKFQSLTVIDGQHRLFAYDGLSEGESDLIYVIGFHKMPLDVQVQTFVNINEKQTKVSPSLMWDLYAGILDPNDIKSRVSKLVKKLNKQKDSALYGVIQYDSADYSNKGSKITLESICTTIKSENIIGVIEGIINKNEIKGNIEEIIFNLINQYFNTIEELNYEHWNRNEKTKNLLRSNQGIGSYLKLYKEILKYIDSKNVLVGSPKDFDTLNWYKKLLIPVNKLILSLKTTDDIKNFKRTGEGGKTQIFYDFVLAINKEFEDFGNSIIIKIENEELEKIRAELLDNSEHETLEAKEAFFTDTKRFKNTGELHKNNEETLKGIIKTVVAFSNSKGGQIVIGLNDPEFDFIGIDNTDLKLYKDWDKLKQAIRQKIDAETENLTRSPEIIKITHNSKTFVIIKVKQLDKKRFEEQDLVTLKSDNHCYKRENADSLVIKSSEIRKYCNLILKEISETETDD